MTKQLIDLTGKTFSHWTVLSRAENTSTGSARWNCRCSCGASRVVDAGNLRSGKSRSCGCLRDRLASVRSAVHGDSKSTAALRRMYGIWKSMLQRCANKKDKFYGGRGITVCERWLNYENFRADMGPTYMDGLTIERKSGDGNYAPENCYWATPQQQARNTRRNRLVTLGDRTQCLAAWCEEFGLSYHRTKRRLNAGWSPERAFGLHQGQVDEDLDMEL